MSDPDFEAMAREVVKNIHNCNDETLHLAGYSYEVDSVSNALRQAYQTGLDARDTADAAAASGSSMDWAHSGPCQPNCTCTAARAASLGGGNGRN